MELSWDDFILWLESRYPRAAVRPDAQVSALVVLRLPGTLLLRVNLDGQPRMLSVPDGAGQHFPVGARVLLRHDGPHFSGAAGRTASSMTAPLLDEGGGFVRPLYSERETPQLPEPGHAPFMLPGHTPATPSGLLYGQSEVSGESGFDFGLMLDDGALDGRQFGEINHVARLGRMWTGSDTSTVAYDAGVYGLQVSSASGISYIKPQTPAVNRTDRTSSGPNGGNSAPTQAEVEGLVLIEVVGFGRCIRGFVIGMKFNDYPVPAVQTTAFQEDNGRHFSGSDDPYPLMNVSTSGTLTGVLTNTKIEIPTDRIRTSGPAGITTYDLPVVQVVMQPNDARLRYFRNSWTDANNVFQVVDWVVSTAGVPASVRHDLVWGSAPEFGGPGYFGASYTLNPVGFAADGDLYLTLGEAIPGSIDQPGAFIDGTPVHWTEYKVISFIFLDGVARLPGAALPLPAVSFQSPVLNGKSFSVSLRNRDLRDRLALEPDCSLDGMAVSIAGGPDLTGWRSFASFRNAAGGITLLLDTDTQVNVTPDLDPARAVGVTWAALLAEWGLSGTPTHLSGHLGHHSYPEDRAYLLLQHASDFHWVSFGEWDAYRDVSAERWAALGLAKPKTRKAFADGLARTPPIQAPPRPAHGLALYDVFAPQAGS